MELMLSVKAYDGCLAFKDVEKNQLTSAGPAAIVPSGDKIGVAAKKLWMASYKTYTFLKEIDWRSDMHLKPQSLKAPDKMIEMGAKTDGTALKAIAEADRKTIGSIDATRVPSAAVYQALSTALSCVIACDGCLQFLCRHCCRRHSLEHVLEGEPTAHTLLYQGPHHPVPDKKPDDWIEERRIIDETASEPEDQGCSSCFSFRSR